MTPFDQIKVLDPDARVAGPYCTALLADLGAEVIKLEPARGDDYRHIGPFKDSDSALFSLNNRGKKNIALNLKDAQELALARRIAAQCDVAVENFRPGVAEKIGLGPDDLRAGNPGLVYARVVGFARPARFATCPPMTWWRRPCPD